MNVLLATDGSPASLDAARLVSTVLNRQQINRVTVLTVIPTFQSTSFFSLGSLPIEQSTWDQLMDSAQRVAQESVSRSAAAIGDGLPVETRILQGTPGEEIVRFARDNGVDIIVMGSRGWGETRALVFGSVSEHVLHAAPCPVLVSPMPHEHARSSQGE